MLIDFYNTLREFKVPVSLREFLDLHDALSHNLAFASEEEFYLLSRTCMVKDEKHFDKFDQAFGKYFKGLEAVSVEWLEQQTAIPEEWLRKELEKTLSPEELEKLKGMGSMEKLMEEFQKRLEQQKKRHEGGNKMIGTAGTSPFGDHGHSKEGMRMKGEQKKGKGKGTKMWEQRNYKNLDDSVELGTRNIKLALRRLRRMARTGAEEELDLDGTIRSTADKAGLLDIIMQREHENKVKVLLFFDVGGSMSPFVKLCEELFSAARTEFKHMEYFYFHNFIYEAVWKDNKRRWNERTSTWDILHKYSSDYKVIFIGDAAMSPYEISSAGGSVEHWNEEPGAVWMQRFTEIYDKVIWLNPEPEKLWDQTTSCVWTRELVNNHMYPLTIKGIENAMKELSR